MAKVTQANVKGVLTELDMFVRNIVKEELESLGVNAEADTDEEVVMEASVFTEEDLEGLHPKELKDLAKELGLEITGKKADVIARILEAQEQEDETPDDEEDADDDWDEDTADEDDWDEDSTEDEDDWDADSDEDEWDESGDEDESGDDEWFEDDEPEEEEEQPKKSSPKKPAPKKQVAKQPAKATGKKKSVNDFLS